MRAGMYQYTTATGEVVRVVVVADVVALPEERWSGGGYGTGISEEWLLREARLPGRDFAHKRQLAQLVRRALADHHGRDLAPTDPARVFHGGRHAG